VQLLQDDVLVLHMSAHTGGTTACIPSIPPSLPPNAVSSPANLAAPFPSRAILSPTHPQALLTMLETHLSGSVEVISDSRYAYPTPLESHPTCRVFSYTVPGNVQPLALANQN
jgi:hypothetical protein